MFDTRPWTAEPFIASKNCSNAALEVTSTAAETRKTAEENYPAGAAARSVLRPVVLFGRRPVDAAIGAEQAEIISGGIVEGGGAIDRLARCRAGPTAAFGRFTL